MENTVSKQIKLITFKVAGHWFTLPMNNILRVVNCPSSERGGVLSFGVIQLGQHTVQLLDLYGVFGLGASPPEQPPFLLVLRNRYQKMLWGIVLADPPDLVELPVAMFKSISTDKRFTPKKQWISHVAVLSEQTISRTLLVLDIKAIFQPNPLTA
ncbi:MAG: chemotaxis protein CheW [Cyanobacteria bacterium P01_C01_bin.118]